jgi:hypothetical protein
VYTQEDREVPSLLGSPRTLESGLPVCCKGCLSQLLDYMLARNTAVGTAAVEAARYVASILLSRPELRGWVGHVQCQSYFAKALARQVAVESSIAHPVVALGRTDCLYSRSPALGEDSYTAKT